MGKRERKSGAANEKQIEKSIREKQKKKATLEKKIL